VLGFKAFLVDSGIEEFPPVGRQHLEAALPFLAESSLPLLVHSEWPAALLPMDPRHPRSHDAWVESRPPAAEGTAVRLLLELCLQRPFPLHIVHVATEEVLPLLVEARRQGLPVTAETCPHYLTFAAEEIALMDADQGATLFKCAPPIRSTTTREALWQALQDGRLDFIATDHSPAPPELKEVESGDFQRAWGGIASLQLALPAVWTEAHRREIGPEHLVPWLSQRPARLAGLGNRKGRIAVGQDADLVAWDPDAGFVVDPITLHHRHPLTPYAGRRLRGKVEATWLRGRCIFESGRVIEEPRGQWL
jgi:allantoinase